MGPFRLLVRLVKNARRGGQFALIVLFLLILYLPGVGMMIRPPRAPVYSVMEEDLTSLKQGWHSGWEANRPLPKLTWRLSSILAFPKDLGEYFRYNFAFRRDFIHWHTKLVGDAMGKSSSQTVVEGKHGWLFLGEHGTIQDYRGMLPFSTQQLQEWQQALESRRDWLARQGIHYLFVVCPDKHTIYPEYMPDKINRVHAQTRLDQLVRHLKEHSNVQILDLRTTLLEFKKIRLCYQPQESHWNGVGAFVGYQQIAERLHAWYPDLRVAAMSDCEISKQPNKLTDLLRLQGRADTRTIMDIISPIGGFPAKLWQDTDPARQLVRSSCSDAPIGKALVVCDSFGTAMMRFLAMHFREALFVWGGGDGFLAQDVLDLKPDVVIQEIVERALCDTMPKPIPCQ